MNERTTLFLMANLGVEMQRLFSYDIHDTKSVQASAIRAKHIVNQIMLKDEIKNRYMEIEKIYDVISDYTDRKYLEVTKEEIENYFALFITRNISLHAIL